MEIKATAIAVHRYFPGNTYAPAASGGGRGRHRPRPMPGAAVDESGEKLCTDNVDKLLVCLTSSMGDCERVTQSCCY